MITVLITAIGGDIGQGVLKALKLYRKKMRIIGTDITPRAPGLFMCDKGYLVSPAGKGASAYVSMIIQICRREKVDIVFCTHEHEQLALARNFKKLKKLKTCFVLQPPAVTFICRDKLKTYKFLSKAGLRVPDTATNRKEIDRFYE